MTIRILFLSANPVETPQLRLDEEVRAIDIALRQSELRDLFELRSHWALRVGDLQELLLRHQPQIVHFSGHGSAGSEIILLDDRGQPAVVPARALSNLFAVLGDDVRCVVLNACFSAAQAAAIAEYIDCVVGMSEEISDRASTQWAAAFYRALGYGRSVQTAFDLGCNQLDLASVAEAHKPRLLGKGDPAEVRFGSTESPGEGEAQAGGAAAIAWWDRLPERPVLPPIATGGGDVIVATIGAGASNVAVGKSIWQTVSEIVGEPTPDDRSVIEGAFDRVRAVLGSLAGREDAIKLQMATFQLQLLEGELTKTDADQTPSATTVTQVGDWLLDTVPALREPLEQLFAAPEVGRVVHKAGEDVVSWVMARFAGGAGS